MVCSGGGDFEPKFKKMQEMYNKLRTDHLTLLKTSAGMAKCNMCHFSGLNRSYPMKRRFVTIHILEQLTNNHGGA